MPKIQTETDENDELQEQIADLKETVQLLLKAQATKGQAGIPADQFEAAMLRIAEVSAQAQERANNPSNKTHPGISVFSYPEGDRARPRAMKCPMSWIGTRMDVDTTTAEEIELLNLAEPGEYTFVATDGKRERLAVEGDRDAAGQITRMLFKFDASKERRPFLPGIVPMLRTALQVKTPEQVQLDALTKELETLRAQAR